LGVSRFGLALNDSAAALSALVPGTAVGAAGLLVDLGDASRQCPVGVLAAGAGLGGLPPAVEPGTGDVQEPAQPLHAVGVVVVQGT
jgi:hypothetical protein